MCPETPFPPICGLAFAFDDLGGPRNDRPSGWSFDPGLRALEGEAAAVGSEEAGAALRDELAGGEGSSRAARAAAWAAVEEEGVEVDLPQLGKLTLRNMVWGGFVGKKGFVDLFQCPSLGWGDGAQGVEGLGLVITYTAGFCCYFR